MSSPAIGGPAVLDASAVLALLFEEPGAGMVCAQLRTGVIGADNLAEVLAKLSDHGLPAQEAARAVAILGLEVAPMTEAQAQRSAELRPAMHGAGVAKVAGVAVQLVRTGSLPQGDAIWRHAGCLGA